MNRTLQGAALAALALIGARLPAGASDIYVITGSSSASQSASATYRFGKINSQTGAYTDIAALATGNFHFGLAYNPALSAFYHVEGTSTSTLRLKTINTSGTVSPIPTVSTNINQKINYLALDTTSGTLYSYDYNSDDFKTINTTTGAWSGTIGSPLTAFGNLGGQAVFHQGQLWWSAGASTSSNSMLGTVNTGSGAFTQVGSNNALWKNVSLATNGNTLYALEGTGTAGQEKLYTVDTTTGVASLVASITGTNLGTRFYGAATTVAAVPEPGEWAAMGILGAGLTGLVLRKRRKA